MPTIEMEYQGSLRTLARHIKSQVELNTDAPTDNKGRGESFSPTDLLVTSLGTCMLTIMGIAAREHDFDIDGTRVELTKIMADAPRRVSGIKVEFFMPEHSYSEREKRFLEVAANTCPVALSIHPDIKQEVLFHFSV